MERQPSRQPSRLSAEEQKINDNQPQAIDLANVKEGDDKAADEVGDSSTRNEKKISNKEVSQGTFPF